MSEHRRYRLGDVASAGLAVLLLFLPWWRSGLVERGYGPAADCGGCLRWASLGNDLWLAGIGILLLALALITNRRWLRLALLVPAFALAAVMLLDTALLDVLGMRLHLLDVLKFGTEGRATGGFFSALLHGGYRPAWPILCLMLAIIVTLPFPADRRPRLAGWAIALTLIMSVAGATMGRQAQGYVHREAVVNIAQLQGMRGVNTPYSDAFARRILAMPPALVRHCEPGQARTPDVILVIMESLSAYHSGLLGGRGLVPELDAIAMRHAWFRNFHANGFTTDHGLIALLDGRLPVPAVGRYLSMHAFDGFGDPQDSAYGVLRRAGYQTTFFTTGNLGFLDKTRWLQAMQVEHFEGSESPYYRGMPRGGFDAADDAALYGRVLQWLDAERDPSRPAFAALLTVETHPPFLDRATGRLDEPGVFLRADAALGDFFRALEQRGFLQHGIVLITGDHRSMTAVAPEEWARWGESALSRVPMVIAGDSGLPRGVVEAGFQQTDLLPSLLQLTTAGEACREAGQGSFLRADPQPAEYVLHARGDQRGRVDILYPDGEAWLDLAGDGSRLGGLHPERSAVIADAIHRDRIERGELPQDMAGALLDLQRQRLLQSR